MRKSRSTDEQIVAILREADRDGVANVANRHAISEQTIYTWKKRFGTFQADDVRRLRPIEQENARLKKLVAEREALERHLLLSDHPNVAVLHPQAAEVGRHIDRMIASIKDGVDPKLLVSELNNAQAKEV